MDSAGHFAENFWRIYQWNVIKSLMISMIGLLA
jgi:hypothetical protein